MVGSYVKFEGFYRHYRQDIIHLYSQLKLRYSIYIEYKYLLEIAVCSAGNYMWFLNLGKHIVFLKQKVELPFM